MSTLRVNNITDTSGGSSSLSVPGAAKAWVNFNGTGTVAIRAQMNVSSITDNGTGNYTVNFTNAMTDANYSSLISTGRGGAFGDQTFGYNYSTPASSNFSIGTTNGVGTQIDVSHIYVAIFR